MAADPLASDPKDVLASSLPGGSASTSLASSVAAHERSRMARAKEELNVVHDAQTDISRVEAEGARQKTEFEEKYMKDRTPPTFEPTQFKPPPETDPIKQWGSAAMVIGAFASLATRTPFKTAMESATATLNAFHAKDQEAYKNAYEQWKTNNDEMLKQFGYQVELFKAAQQELDRLGKGIDQETQRKKKDIIDGLKWTLHGMDAQNTADSVAAHGEEFIASFTMSGARALVAAEAASGKIDANFTTHSEIEDWDAKHPSASLQEKARAHTRILRSNPETEDKLAERWYNQLFPKSRRGNYRVRLQPQMKDGKPVINPATGQPFMIEAPAPDPVAWRTGTDLPPGVTGYPELVKRLDQSEDWGGESPPPPPAQSAAPQSAASQQPPPQAQPNADRKGPAPADYKKAPDGYHYKKLGNGKFERWEAP